MGLQKEDRGKLRRLERAEAAFATKVHALAYEKGPFFVERAGLSAGNVHDLRCAKAMTNRLPECIFAVAADKAYDAAELRLSLRAMRIKPIIASRKNARVSQSIDPLLYRKRNEVERFFARLKHFRRVATRYERLAAHFSSVLLVGFSLAVIGFCCATA